MSPQFRWMYISYGCHLLTTGCAADRYGPFCISICGCQNGAPCSPIDGSCACKDGYVGTSCENRKLTAHLHAVCQVSGIEYFRRVSIANTALLLIWNDLWVFMYRKYGLCRPVHYNHYPVCSSVHITACPSGTFGATCSKTCNCVNGNCSNIDGVCSCFGGYFGASCNTPCPPGRHGSDCLGVCNCQNSGVCSPVNGSCTCAAGFTGKNCSTGESLSSSISQQFIANWRRENESPYAYLTCYCGLQKLRQLTPVVSRIRVFCCCS